MTEQEEPRNKPRQSPETKVQYGFWAFPLCQGPLFYSLTEANEWRYKNHLNSEIYVIFPPEKSQQILESQKRYSQFWAEYTLELAESDEKFAKEYGALKSSTVTYPHDLEKRLALSDRSKQIRVPGPHRNYFLVDLWKSFERFLHFLRCWAKKRQGQ